MDLSSRILRVLARVGRREFAQYCSPRMLRQLRETGLQDSREVLELIALDAMSNLPDSLEAVRSLLDPAVLPEALEWVRSLDNTYGWRDEALRALVPVVPEAERPPWVQEVLASLPPPSPDVPEPAGRGGELPRPAWEGASPEERLELQRRALWDLCNLVDVTSGEAGHEPDEAFSACGRLGAVLDPCLRDEAIRMLLQQVPERYHAVNAAAALCESFPLEPKTSAMRAVWRELQASSGYPGKRSELMPWLRDLEPRPRAPRGSVPVKVEASAPECARAMELARMAMLGPRERRVETVVSMLQAARGCSAHELVLEELVHPLSDPAVYGEPEVHVALGDFFDGVSRLSASDLVECLRSFRPVLLRMGGVPMPPSGWPLPEGTQVPRDEAAVVREDELEPNDLLEMCYRGVPFTGIAIEFHRSGLKSSEVSYVEGTQSGVARDYSEDGRVVYEAHYLNGGLHGVAREWYPGGALRSEAVYEFGIEVSRREWDSEEKLRVSRELAPDSELFRLLEERRKNHAGRPLKT